MLWEGGYPPYIWTFFFCFSILFLNLFLTIFFSLLALLDCASRANAVAQTSVIGRPSVRPSSVKRVVSETFKQINAKYCGKVAIHPISRPFFPFFKILDFWTLMNFLNFR